MSEKNENHSVYFVPGLHRGLRVLEILASADQPMRLSELAAALGVSRSSAFRIVYTLRDLEFLKEGNQKNTYTLGARVLNLGFAYLSQQPIVALSRPRLEWLRDKTGVSTHLSALQGVEVLYLDTHQAKSAFVSSTSTGTRAAAYASPVGWCLLASHSDEEIDELFEEIVFEARTDFTPMSCADLKGRVQQARKDGYVFSNGWYDPGGSTLATPVHNHVGRIVGCIDLSGPDSGFDPSKVETVYLPSLRTAAAKISAELGFQR
jgi:IclR family pca regulon transcriptional regulator